MSMHRPFLRVLPFLAFLIAAAPLLASDNAVIHRNHNGIKEIRTDSHKWLKAIKLYTSPKVDIYVPTLIDHNHPTDALIFLRFAEYQVTTYSVFEDKIVSMTLHIRPRLNKVFVAEKVNISDNDTPQNAVVEVGQEEVAPSTLGPEMAEAIAKLNLMVAPVYPEIKPDFPLTGCAALWEKMATNAPDAPHPIGPRVPRPRRTDVAKYVYPRASHEARYRGKLIVNIIIEPDGRATCARIVQHAPYGNDQAALDYLSHAQYEHPTYDGLPARIQMDVTLNVRTLIGPFQM